MKKKGSNEVITSVYNSLKRGPKSINDVADAADTNWESARNSLELLESLGVVIESEDGNKRIFKLKEPCAVYGGDTLFGLPLTDERNNLIAYLFMRIRKKWIKKTGFFPNKSQVQKVLVKTVDDCKLDVPVGWYKFGMISVRNYDPSIDYVFVEPSDSKRIDEYVDCAVDFYKDCRYSADLKRRQYSSKSSQLYLLKEKLSEIAVIRFTDTNRSMLRQLLTEFAFAFPLKEDNRDLVNVLNTFLATVISVVKNNDEEGLDACRTDLSAGFDALWDMVATYMFYDSLRAYYSKDILDGQFRTDLEYKKNEVMEHISHLEGCAKQMPDEEFAEKKFLDKFVGIVPPKEKMGQEGRRKLAEDFQKNKKRSDVFREYGID
jgi:DNA-binding transcriptional ArsR family regulator